MSGERVKELLLSLERDTVPSNAWKILEELGIFDRYGRLLPSRADIFEIDEVARALYPRDADPGLLPLRVYGDGNSRFRSASLLFYSDENRHLDLRLRTAAELCMNSRHYAQATVQRASSSCATSLSATALLSLVSSFPRLWSPALRFKMPALKQCKKRSRILAAQAGMHQSYTYLVYLQLLGLQSI